MFDVVVIGSGPAGYVAAIRASQLGLKTLCIEELSNDKGKPNFGGTCLNVGCIPSKSLLDSSHRYYEAKKNLSDHGIQLGDVKLDLKTMMERKDNIVSKLTGGIDGLFLTNKVESICGKGKVISKNTVQIDKADGSSEKVDAKNIIIATGSSPIEIPAASFGKHIVDSTGALAFDSVPKRLGVVGAGIIGLELGSVWSRLGSEVTVIEALEDFLPMTDTDISKESFKEFKKQGLDIQLASKVTSTKELKNLVKVKYEHKGKEIEVEFDKLIVAVGRKPNSEKVLPKNLGIKIENGFIQVNEYCQTSVENIWAVGDVVRGPMLAHKGSEEGIMVAERIANKQAEVNYDLVPNVIYSHPEIAWVGKNENELKSSGIKYKVGKFPFAASGRALAMGAGSDGGFVRITSRKDNQVIVGIHAVGSHVSELSGEFALALEMGARLDDVAGTIHVHPTLTEAFAESALASLGHALHISN